jgi:hypothetical protein
MEKTLPSSKIQKKNLAGKNLLCKGTRFYSISYIQCGPVSQKIACKIFYEHLVLNQLTIFD